jgi:Radical SAM superfamily/Iron-sulfur cluster-binding domain
MPCLEITTMVGCPLKCTYCPQDQLKGTYGKNEKYLSLENFKLILSKIPDYVRIDFSGMAEPWANPSATAMLRHALESGFQISVYTTLYSMGVDDARQVLGLLSDHASQVEVLCLHLPDNNGNMRGFRHSYEYEAILAAFIRLGASGVLRRFETMTMDRKGLVDEKLRNTVKTLPPWVGHTRADALDTSQVGGQPIEVTPHHEAPVTCGFTPFYDHNVLLPNGDVVLCCMDYSLKHKVGNLIDNDYFSIFASPGMAQLHAENTKPHYSEKSICKSCSRAVRYEVADQRQFWRVARA